MLSPDNFVQDPYGTQNFNRYGYVLNNPLVYVDENGEFFFVPILIGIGVGILANGVSNAIQGKSFFSGWVQAGIMGGIGGYFAGVSANSNFLSTVTKGFTSTVGATGGQQALASAISVASSYLPGLNIPLGDHFAIGLSPALFFGPGGLGAGANASVSFSSKYVDFGVGVGSTAWSRHLFSGGRFLEGRFSGQVAVGTSDFKLGAATSYFS